MPRRNFTKESTSFRRFAAFCSSNFAFSRTTPTNFRPCLEQLESRTLLNGLTIIAHGLEITSSSNTQVNLNNEILWADTMAQAIATRAGPNTAIYDLQLDHDSSNNPYVSNLILLSGQPPTSNSSSNAETVLLIDWAQDSTISPYFSTATMAQLIMPYLINAVPSAGINAPLAQGPIQIIGHSRGASLASALAQDLGHSGIWVDQLTTLDPVPVGSDPGVSVGSNVVFADNYYQDSGDGFLTPNGSAVSGAVNFGPLSLGSAYSILDGATHSDVHLFYYGTIDTSADANDGDYSVPASWYPGNDVNRDTTGFYYSRIGGGLRPLNGLSTAFGGTANRSSVSTSGTQWPNIGDIDYVTDPDGKTTFFYRYQDNSSNPVTVSWYLDSDTNPYNNNNVQSLGSSYSVAPTGSSIGFGAFGTTFTGNPADVYAEITDGTNTRYVYAYQQMAAPTVLSGQANSGTVAPGGPVLYKFTAVAGGSIAATISSSGTSLNPRVQLLNSSGTLIGSATPSGPGHSATLNTTTPAAGTYFLLVSSANSGSGTYNLTATYQIGPAIQLAYIQQPTAATTTSTITPPITIAVEDVNGNVVTTDNSSVTIAVASGPAVPPNGTLTVEVQNGIATFSDISFTQTGTYTLLASDDDLTAATSNSFNIVLPPTHLVIVQEPSNTTGGAVISPAIIVDVEDADNNIVTADNSNVTFTIASGPDGALLGGTTTVAAQNGVATFSSLMLTTVGMYTLTAADGSLTTDTSSSFTVSLAPITITGDALVTFQTGGSGSPGEKPLDARLFKATSATNFTNQSLIYGDQRNGTYTYTQTGLTTATISETDSQGLHTAQLTFITATTGTYQISEPGGTQDGTFTLYITPLQNIAPASTAGDNLLFGITTGGGADQTSGDYRILPTSGGAYALQVISGDISNSTGSYSYTRTIDSVPELAKFSYHDSANGTGTIYLAFTSATSGVFYSSDATSSNQLPDFQTGTFTVAMGAAPTQLVAIQQPANTAIGNNVSPAFSFDVQDANGNVVTTDHSMVTLTVATGPLGSTPHGTVTATVQNGIATFSKVSFLQAGDYTLQASDGILTPAITSSFNVFFVPTHLVFSRQPGNAVAGQAINPAVVVYIEDGAGRIDTTNNSNVTIALGAPSNGATLSGTLTEAAVNGVATFNDLSLTKTGNYSLVVSDNALTTAKSGNFSITPDASSAQLILIQQPASTIVGKPMTPTIIVDVKDQFGNIVTTNHSTVTLSITSGPDSANFIGTATATTSNGVATFSKVALSQAGTYTIQAADATLAIATPVSFSQTITQGTTTVVTPSVYSSYIFGQTITLSTTLKSNAPTTIPFTGTASITDQNSDVLGTVNVSTNGAVKFVLAGLTPGSYVCTLAYPGDVNFTAVTSTAFTLNILQAATTTTLKASSTQLVSGQGVTLTATVASTNAPATARTGTITFKDGATVIGTVNLSNSTAALAIATPTVGTHAYTAVYSSDTNFKASASSTQNVTVKKDTTHAALSTSAVGTIVPGQQFTLTAVITDVAPGVGTTTGTVTFKDGSTVLGTGTLDNTGTATLPTSLATAGNHSLTAVYSGDGQSNTVTSTALAQVVAKAITTTVVSSPNATVSSGTNVTFTAIVTPNSPANLIPTGKVVFKDGVTTLATVTLVDGQAIWTTTIPLTTGSHSITASYLGDNNDLASTSDVYTQVLD